MLEFAHRRPPRGRSQHAEVASGCAHGTDAEWAVLRNASVAAPSVRIPRRGRAREVCPVQLSDVPQPPLAPAVSGALVRGRRPRAALRNKSHPQADERRNRPKASGARPPPTSTARSSRASTARVRGRRRAVPRRGVNSSLGPALAACARRPRPCRTSAVPRRARSCLAPVPNGARCGTAENRPRVA